MFGWTDRDHGQRGDRSFSDRSRGEMREWFGGQDRDRDSSRSQYGAGQQDWRGQSSDYGRSEDQRGYGSAGGWQQNSSSERYSAHPDDHYRSWRDKQMQALDRDYQDYCREREQQFHSDFDSWRSQRGGNNPGPLRTGMTGTGQSLDPTGTLELTNEATDNEEPVPDPTDAATLGTNSSDRGL